MSTTKAPRTPRSVVNMPAIESTPAAAAASVKKVRDVALVSTLVLAVTAAGVAVGALGIAPFLRNEPMQRIENAAVAVLGMVFEAAGAVALNGHRRHRVRSGARRTARSKRPPDGRGSRAARAAKRERA